MEKYIEVTMPCGKKVGRKVKGKTIEEVLYNAANSDYKKHKRFVTAFNKAVDIEIESNTVYKTKVKANGKHLKIFITNCNNRFKKMRHRDIMLMLKLKYTASKIAEQLNTSTNNLKTLIKQIFEILGVSSRYQAVAVLSIK